MPLGARPEQGARDEWATGAEILAMEPEELPAEAKGATAAGGGDLTPGYTRLVWGKFWVGGQHCSEWAHEEDEADAEPLAAERAWEIAQC